MKPFEYEQKVLDSKRSAVLEILPGWYLSDPGHQWAGWNYDDRDFVKKEVSITSNLSRAAHFEFGSRKDMGFRFAKVIAQNFPGSRFVGMKMTLNDEVFTVDQE